jgi:hypothetical protein
MRHEAAHFRLASVCGVYRRTGRGWHFVMLSPSRFPMLAVEGDPRCVRLKFSALSDASATILVGAIGAATEELRGRRALPAVQAAGSPEV